MPKKKFFSPGFFILSSICIVVYLTITWALSPLSYEKAMYEEQQGHQLVALGKHKEASKHFLAAAKLDDDNISISIRYRCAGTTTQEDNQKIEYFKLALKYDPNNEDAKRELEELLKNYRYKNRYQDGWSKGNQGIILIDVKNSKEIFELEYFTSNLSQENSVQLFIDKKGYFKHDIISGNIYKKTVSLERGKHLIELIVDKTFNPKQLGMSEDDRHLGIHYTINKEMKLN